MKSEVQPIIYVIENKDKELLLQWVNFEAYQELLKAREALSKRIEEAQSPLSK